MQTMVNMTEKTVKFQIDGAPNGRSTRFYEVEPGDTVDLPAKYVASGCIANIAPGLEPAPEKTAEELAAEKKRAAIEKAKATRARNKAEKERQSALAAAEEDDEG
jgi:hypothetical protein